MNPPLFKINAVSGIASAWKYDQQGTRAFIMHHRADNLYHWHTTQHGRDGEPIKQGKEATAELAFQKAAEAMGAQSYKLA